MPPTLGDRLAHIIESIDSIQELISGKTEQEIASNRMLQFALERMFEIICEASRHVPAEVRAKENNIDWPGMTNLGNLLRHAYHRVDTGRLMAIAQADLPPLKAFVERIIREEDNK